MWHRSTFHTGTQPHTCSTQAAAQTDFSDMSIQTAVGFFLPSPDINEQLQVSEQIGFPFTLHCIINPKTFNSIRSRKKNINVWNFRNNLRCIFAICNEDSMGRTIEYIDGTQKPRNIYYCPWYVDVQLLISTFGSFYDFPFWKESFEKLWDFSWKSYVFPIGFSLISPLSIFLGRYFSGVCFSSCLFIYCCSRVTRLKY